MDSVPGKHRLFLDALTGPGAGEALLFAGNFLNNSKAAYGMADNDSAIVICLRHFATPFAWTDPIWVKYGEPFTEMLTKVKDPKTGKAPAINLYRVAGYGLQLTNLGTTIDDLIKRGVQFAVCDTATHFTASQLAQATKGDADAIYKDLHVEYDREFALCLGRHRGHQPRAGKRLYAGALWMIVSRKS